MKHLNLLAVLFFCVAAFALTLSGPALHAQAVLPSSLENRDGLGDSFDSVLAGITFSPPAGSVQQRSNDDPDLVAEFVNADKQWDLKVTRIHLPEPMPLTTVKDSKGDSHKGIQESVVDELRKQLPGSEIVRNDQTNVADSTGKYPNVGMIAVRFADGTSPRLLQRAIVQGDSLYYLIDFTTPGAKAGTPAEVVDPQEKAAVELFAAMLDSVRLRDNADIKEEQIQRLFRAHAFYYNLTPAAYKRALVPEQWLRIVQDGKDIGYSLIVEELAKQGNREGFRVTVKSRTFPGKGKQLDSESQLFCAFDRSHEEWTSTSALTAEDRAALNVSEVGISEREFRSVEKKDPPILGNFRAPTTRASSEKSTEGYKLSVTFSHNSVKPLTRDLLPPYYLQQALGHLLPRLLPLNHPQTFLFATYVPDQREVVMRYVDVGAERDVTFDGVKIHAIPILDRLGYEGVPTTHYISPEGKYLGSYNKQSKTTLIPSNEATVESIFAKPAGQ
jgi:hypothetical protein